MYPHQFLKGLDEGASIEAMCIDFSLWEFNYFMFSFASLIGVYG